MIMNLLAIPLVVLNYLALVNLFSRRGKRPPRKKNPLIPLGLMVLVFVPLVLAYIYGQTAFDLKNIGRSIYFECIILYLILIVSTAYVFALSQFGLPKRGIFKLLMLIYTALLYIIIISWNIHITDVGAKNGKLQVSAEAASQVIDKSLEGKVNHQMLDSQREYDYWLVNTLLKTRDAKFSIKRGYWVGISDGKIYPRQYEKSVSVSVYKNGQPADDTEMMLSASDGVVATPDPRDYAVTNSNGEAALHLSDAVNSENYLQIRDCTVMCRSFNYYFKKQYKDSYRIDLDPRQDGVLELN